MSFTNYETKEINIKVIYFGPAGSGKTTNLRALYKATSSEIRSGLMDLTEPIGPTRFYDFLPISLGNYSDYHLKLHLYSLPFNSLYGTLNSVMLRGVDGFIFVADSRIEVMGENLEAMFHCKNLLSEEGYNVADLPRVIQYNKRDLSDIVSLDILRKELNPAGFPDHEAVAISSVGTMETLQMLTKQILHKLNLN